MLTGNNFDKKAGGLAQKSEAGWKKKQKMCLHTLTQVILAKLVMNFKCFMRNKCLYLL